LPIHFKLINSDAHWKITSQQISKSFNLPTNESLISYNKHQQGKSGTVNEKEIERTGSRSQSVSAN
jgi:hypothetical protein